MSVSLTPGEIVECIHALKSMTRFNNTEQRDNNESALIELEDAYDRYIATYVSSQESRSSEGVYTKITTE